MTTARRPPVSVRLLERLRGELGRHGVELPVSARCVRQYPGEGDRRNGAWSWSVDSDELETPAVGSQWPMREVLAAHTWHVGCNRWGEWEIDLA